MSDPSTIPPAAAPIDTAVRVLGYPHHYFDIVTGKGPANVKEAEMWWQYRHDRPNNPNEMFDIPPDGRKMMDEICTVRDELRHHVSSELLQGFIDNCIALNITMPSNNQSPKLHKDLKQIIATWSSNVNLYQRLIYIIFHKFHKERNWLSTVVDKFLKANNMYLLPYTATEKKKVYTNDRGGFGVVARRAKAQTIRTYMNFLYKNQVWMIATTLSSKKNRDYTKVTAAEFDDSITNKKT
jgi:hypothetical protein